MQGGGSSVEVLDPPIIHQNFFYQMKARNINTDKEHV